MLKKSLLLFALIASTQVFGQGYPLAPDQRLTPGMLCELRQTYRYPEQIPYCAREVSREVKEEVFADYIRIGYRINMNQRGDYKIDHYIPLCAGGSNNKANLWPQHFTVYNVTDSIEALVCEKMAQGKLSQKNAVSLIQTVKLDLRRANEVIRYLNNLN